MRKATLERLKAKGISPDAYRETLKERSVPVTKTKRYATGGRFGGKTGWESDTKAVKPPDMDIPAWQRIVVHKRDGSDRPDLSDLAAPAVIKYRDKAERKLRESVPKKIPQLLREYFSFDPMPFHARAIHDMFAGGKYVKAWPTDHAKSLTSSYWFILLSLMNDPNESHIICGANINDSKRRLRALQFAIQTNKLLARDYPWIGKPKRKDDSSWSTVQFNVVGNERGGPNPNVLASSTTSADIRGRRGKLILDDVEGKDHRDSALKRMQLYDFIKLEAIRCWEDRGDTVQENQSPRPLLIAVGTPFDPASIYFRLQSEGWEAEYLPWRDKETTKLLWPAKYDKIMEHRKMLTPLQFAIAYEMDPTGGNPDVLTFEEIQKRASAGESIERQDLAATLVSIDPASGSVHRRADYAGISVVKIFWPKDEPFPQVEVLECVKSHEGPDEQVKVACRLAIKHAIGGKPLRVMYEDNSQQGGNYRAWFKTLPEANGIETIPFHTTQEKKQDPQLGMKTLKSLLRMGRLKVHGDFEQDEGARVLLEEIRDMGTTPHDHLTASVWFVIFWAHVNHRYGKPKIRNTFRRPPQRGFGYRALMGR